MDGKEAAAFIHFAAHHFKQILLFIAGANILQAAFNPRAFAFVPRLNGKLVQGFQIVNGGAQPLPRLVAVFEGFQFGHGFFSRRGIVPEIRLGGFRFKFVYALPQRVKAASMFRIFLTLFP
jgi:hypothetical protein